MLYKLFYNIIFESLDSGYGNSQADYSDYT